MPESQMPKRKRLIISDAAVPFVARGGRIFGQQVVDADSGIKDGEEILVVDRRNHPIITARAII